MIWKSRSEISRSHHLIWITSKMMSRMSDLTSGTQIWSKIWSRTQIWSKSDQIWSKCGPEHRFWPKTPPNRVLAHQVVAKLIILIKTDKIGISIPDLIILTSKVIRFGPKVIKSDQKWSDLIRFDQIWSEIDVKIESQNLIKIWSNPSKSCPPFSIPRGWKERQHGYALSCSLRRDTRHTRGKVNAPLIMDGKAHQCNFVQTSIQVDPNYKLL